RGQRDMRQCVLDGPDSLGEGGRESIRVAIWADGAEEWSKGGFELGLELGIVARHLPRHRRHSIVDRAATPADLRDCHELLYDALLAQIGEVFDEGLRQRTGRDSLDGRLLRATDASELWCVERVEGVSDSGGDPVWSDLPRVGLLAGGRRSRLGAGRRRRRAFR